MKIVIIGGGIAGLTLGILLKKKKFQIVINEKSYNFSEKGHAFLIHSDGLNILNALPENKSVRLKCKEVNYFGLKRLNNTEVKKTKLNDWYCIKRKELIDFLSDNIPHEFVKLDREFLHFIYKEGKAIAAVFKNGEIEYGDLFIGADGGNSKVRESIFGMVQFTPIEVKEIVGSLTRDIPIKDGEIKFQKIQDNNSGLAFGYIPTSDKEIVWFLQFAAKIEESMTITSKNLKLFCNELLKDFPEDVKNIINANDFSTTYVWNTHDFDLLPTFSHKNIVLIGDAAHLTLPFTSTGVTNAILDANALYNALMQFEDYNKVYEEYYRVRSENIKINIEQGRVLKKLFLNPDEIIHRNIPIPLSSIITENKIKPIQKKLKILYFTDPVCSTCWVIEPVLRKLKMEYGDYLEIEYRMGGLLPSWKNYERGNIKIPSDAAKHWNEVSKLHDVPIDGDIWFEDPLSSSFPPSIAFKAAQLQSEYKALKFLRIIKEMVFIDRKNITKWDLIEEAALNVGLDSVVLLNDISGDAVNFFKADLDLAKKYDVKKLPTFYFLNLTEKIERIEGLVSYSKFEEIILNFLPNAIKFCFDKDPILLFKKFNNITESEFAFLSDCSKETATIILSELHQNGLIEKKTVKNSIIYRYIKI